MSEDLHSVPCLKKFLLIASLPDVSKPQEIALSIEFLPSASSQEALDSVMAALERLVTAYKNQETICHKKDHMVHVPSVHSIHCDYNIVTKEPI